MGLPLGGWGHVFGLGTIPNSVVIQLMEPVVIDNRSQVIFFDSQR